MSKPDANYIYLITAMEKPGTEKTDIGFLDFGSTCTFGYFFDLEQALDRVTNNVTDIQECCYNYAMITKVPEGLYPETHIDMKEDILFFEYNAGTDKYEQRETPNWGPYCFVAP